MQVHRRGSAYGRVSCAYQSAGAEYVRKHAGGGENRAQPQERRRRLPPYGAKPPHAGTREPARVWLRWMARVHYRVAREKGVQPDSVCVERATRSEREKGGAGARGRERGIARVARRRTRRSGERRTKGVWEGRLESDGGWRRRRSSGGAGSGGRRRQGGGGGGGGGEHKIPRTCLVHSLRGDVPVQRTRRPASTPPSRALSVPPLASVALCSQLSAHAAPLVLPDGLVRAVPHCAVNVPSLTLRSRARASHPLSRPRHPCHRCDQRVR